MNITQHLLTKLVEECAEVQQIALKAQQFGLDDVAPNNLKSNIQRLHAELNDLWGVVELLNEESGLDYKVDLDAIDKKKAKVRKWRNYSAQLGLVYDNTKEKAKEKPSSRSRYPNITELLDIISKVNNEPLLSEFYWLTNINWDRIEEQAASIAEDDRMPVALSADKEYIKKHGLTELDTTLNYMFNGWLRKYFFVDPGSC